MALERKPSRYAHNEGHTDVCYSLDGEKILTCGSDGDVRVWTGFNDVDPLQTCVGEWALCVRQRDKHIYVATDNNDVQLVTFPECERDGILVRFTAHASHIALAEHHDLIAVASEDMEIRVLNTKDKNICYNFTGVTGPPLSIAMSEDGKLLAVSSGDGYLRIWNIETQGMLKEIQGVPKTNSFMNAKLLCRIDFHPTKHSLLAYPLEQCVHILDTTDWSEKATLTCYSLNSPYSIVQYSPCGNFLAASTQLGDLIIWEVDMQTVINVSTHPSSVAICALSWNPKGNGEIVYCDVNGQMGLVINCNKTENQEANEDINDDVMDELDFKKTAEESEDDDDENVISLEKIKRDVIGVGETGSESRSEMPVSPSPILRIPEIPMQSAFMPTSTPEHLNPRYLCWNEIGVVRSYGNTDDENISSIEVEFHDSTLHNSIMMQNYQGYTMASLSSSVLAVASSSQLTVVPLNSAVKEWSLTMAENEEINLVAASTNLVCFTTASYNLRICSLYGIQRAVLRIPGPVVSISSKENFVLFAYHTSSPRDKDQCIKLMIVKLEGTKIESKEIGNALGPESTLSWLGFSDAGTPAMQDSLGMLSLYLLRSEVWVPYCDTSKNQTAIADGFFITAVDEMLGSVRGIRCRSSNYPGFIPRPVLTELPLQPPFVELDTEKAQLEANLFMWSNLKVDGTEKKFKETALKSFALSCKSNLDHRALELVQMLGNPQLLNLAMKYASKQNRRLAEKLMEIAPLMQNSDNDDSSFTPTPEASTVKQVPKRMVLSSLTKSVNRIKTQRSQTVSLSKNVEGVENISTQEESLSETVENSTIENINTQESLFSEEPKNPFLKKAKSEVERNPLSLTDKLAGVEFEEETKKKALVNSKIEKRKTRENDVGNQKGKQRKLDRFTFKK